MQGPLRATVDDFDALIGLVDTCFPTDTGRGGMLARWGHCYIRRPAKLRNCLILKDGDRLVSHVEYVDEILLVEGSQLKLAGISGVATLPEYRGRGLMTRLLKHCINLMEEEGYVLAELGGDTQRYRRFGWESAGREWAFQLTPRSLGEFDPPVGWKVSGYQGSKEEIEFIKSIHEKEPMSIKRTDELYQLLLGREGWQTWLAEGAKGARAYMVLQADDRKHQDAWELGGKSAGVHAIASHLMQKQGVERLMVFLPWSHPLNALLFKLSSSWEVQPHRMVRVNNLAGALKAFLPELRRRCNELKVKGQHTISLALAGTEQKARLVFAGGDVKLETDNVKGALELDRLQMVRFLFGPGAAGTEVELPSDARFLNSLLPLDFYIWHLEWV